MHAQAHPSITLADARLAALSTVPRVPLEFVTRSPIQDRHELDEGGLTTPKPPGERATAARVGSREARSAGPHVPWRIVDTRSVDDGVADADESRAHAHGIISQPFSSWSIQYCSNTRRANSWRKFR